MILSESKLLSSPTAEIPSSSTIFSKLSIFLNVLTEPSPVL
jgi:hypothetical protein